MLTLLQWGALGNILLYLLSGGGSDSSHALYTNDISNGAFEVLLDANYLASIEVES